MNSVLGIGLETLLRQKVEYCQNIWDMEFQEPANMVVVLGDNPITGKNERFHDYVPTAKIRPKDNRSILVFNVEIEYRPYISPISGGVAYSVKEDGTNILIKDSTMWELKEVHIVEIKDVGNFVGTLLHFKKSKESGYMYCQWRATSTCPPLFYGLYPKNWAILDEKYLRLHRDTIKLAQVSPRYENCDTNMCCIRHGCEVVYCQSVDPVSPKPCHKKETCVNFKNEYEGLLKKWIVCQQKAQNELLAKIPNPITALQNKINLEAFKKFSEIHFSEKNKEFFLTWQESIEKGQSDFQFITDWKIQKSKDQSFKKALIIFQRAEIKWMELNKLSASRQK